MTDRELMQLAREKERADANEDDAKRWRNIKGYWRGVERELADAKERAERAEAELAALRERLAQPEPVAWPCVIAEADFEKKTITLEMQCNDYKVAAGKYWLCTTASRQWQGLTDEEVGALTVFDGLHHVEVPVLADFIRAIEAKIKEKNT